MMSHQRPDSRIFGTVPTVWAIAQSYWKHFVLRHNFLSRQNWWYKGRISKQVSGSKAESQAEHYHPKPEKNNSFIIQNSKNGMPYYHIYRHSLWSRKNKLYMETVYFFYFRPSIRAKAVLQFSLKFDRWEVVEKYRYSSKLTHTLYNTIHYLSLLFLGVYLTMLAALRRYRVGSPQIPQVLIKFDEENFHQTLSANSPISSTLCKATYEPLTTTHRTQKPPRIYTSLQQHKATTGTQHRRKRRAHNKQILNHIIL